MKPKIVVMSSGNGSTFQAIVEQCQVAEVAALVSDKPHCYSIERADRLGIPHHASSDRPPELFLILGDIISYYQPDLVVLAGFMRIVPKGFIARYPRMVNIHPSLLPMYKGLHTHRRVLEAGDQVHGTTIHQVVEELDSGPILAQESVPVLEGDTPEILQERVQVVERKLYPKVIDDILLGKMGLTNTR